MHLIFWKSNFGMQEMIRKQVNRTVVVLRPKLPFLKWIATVEPDISLTLEQLRAEQDAMLVFSPEIETIHGAQEWAYRNWQRLFDKSLFDWYTDEKYWPQGRDLALFKVWFDIEWHPIVWDLSSESIQ